MVISAGWTKVSFPGSQGGKIAGLLYTPPLPAKKIIVVCHGFTGSKEGGGRALEMAEEFGRQGWATLLFDFAGCGESAGSFEDLTLSGQIGDLNQALHWCKQKGYPKIVTLGRSFGGSTVICQAARDSSAAGVCTWAAPARLTGLFTSLGDEEGDRLVFAGEKGIVHMKKNFLDDLYQYDVARDAACISPRPLLIIHGTSDELVSPTEAQIIYQAAKEPKRLVWIEQGDHQFTRHYRQVWQVVQEWLATSCE